MNSPLKTFVSSFLEGTALEMTEWSGNYNQNIIQTILNPYEKYKHQERH